MYKISNIINALTNPIQFPLEAYRLYKRHVEGERGVQVMEEDWDNLIIIDACRYDLFEQVSNLPGELTSVVSAGSHTMEFMQNNFAEKHLDTVYVSGTPQFARQNLNDRFHDFIPVWEEGWDEELDVVPPEAMYEAAVQALEEHPNKRIIVHFLQPHYPFIGEQGRKIEHETIVSDPSEKEMANIWERLESGEIDTETVWKAYRENLKLVLPHVENTIEALDGKSVVTSDHGNLLGKWGIYGHPPRLFVDELVTVPWLEPGYDNRREIVTADSVRQQEINTDIDDRLEALGYR